MVLYKLLSGIDRNIFTSEVISLTDIGAIGDEIESLNVPVRALGMPRGIPNPLMVLKLVGWLKRSNPDVIQTWMYHADLLGGLAAKMIGGIPVIWGIHHSNLDPQYNKRLTILTSKLCSKLSRHLPQRIVCVSPGARKVHEQIGYAADKMAVVPNGIDTSVFKPDKDCNLSVCRELGLAENTILIGMIARFNPQKDHLNFIKAAAKLHNDLPTNTHYLLCGHGIAWDNEILTSWIESAGLRHCFSLLGVRGDVPRLTASLNIATLSSFGESFSLTLGEAMSCGVPCVTTDIEGPVDLLGGHGWVVPVNDAGALYNAWTEILNFPKKMMEQRLKQARGRIQQHFSLGRMVAEYQNLYKGTVNSR